MLRIWRAELLPGLRLVPSLSLMPLSHGERHRRMAISRFRIIITIVMDMTWALRRAPVLRPSSR